MQKNQIVSHSGRSTFRPKTHSKTITCQTTSSTYSRHQLPQLSKPKDMLECALPRIVEAWEMVEAMKLQSSQSTILKYLKKRMEAKAFHYTQLIIDILRIRSLPRGAKKKEGEINSEILRFEVEEMKEQLQGFLLKRFSRDMEIMREKIGQADCDVKDSVDIDQYQRLVLSFRPLLITSNSNNLAEDYQTLLGPVPAQAPRSAKLQQFRFHKLAKLQREVCCLHNKVIQMKSDTKLFPVCQEAIADFL